MSTITWPTLTRTAPRVMQFGLRSPTQVFESPLSGAVQTAEIPYSSRWTIRWTLEGLDEADAALVQAFLVQLRGRANRAALYHFGRPQPRGTINTSGVTLNASASQGATSVALTGCGAGKTVEAGDLFSVAGELKMATATATANGSGVISALSFEPPARAAWSSGAAVTLDKPTALFIAAGDDAGWSMRPYRRTDHEFDFVEVFS